MRKPLNYKHILPFMEQQGRLKEQNQETRKAQKIIAGQALDCVLIRELQIFLVAFQNRYGYCASNFPICEQDFLQHLHYVCLSTVWWVCGAQITFIPKSSDRGNVLEVLFLQKYARVASSITKPNLDGDIVGFELIL